MDVLPVIVILLIACIAGYLADVSGVGGGILLVPALIVYFNSSGTSSLVSTHLAVGTSSLVAGATLLIGAGPALKNGQIETRGVVYMSIAGTLLAVAGSVGAAAWQGATLRKFFAVVTAIAAVVLVFGVRRSKRERAAGNPGLMAAGALNGLLTSLTGIAGDVVSMPILYGGLGFPLKRAEGTSRMASGIIALFAGVGYCVFGWSSAFLPGGTLGFVDLKPAIPAFVGMAAGLMIAPRLTPAGTPATWRKVYAVGLFVLATKMFFFS
jgi:uncharacterized membrane protein YfcA